MADNRQSRRLTGDDIEQMQQLNAKHADTPTGDVIHEEQREDEDEDHCVMLKTPGDPNSEAQNGCTTIDC